MRSLCTTNKFTLYFFLTTLGLIQQYEIFTVPVNLLQVFYHQGLEKDILMFYADSLPTIRHESLIAHGLPHGSCWILEHLTIVDACRPFLKNFKAVGAKRGVRFECEERDHKARIIIEKTQDPCVYTFDSIGGKKGILIVVAQESSSLVSHHKSSHVIRNNVRKKQTKPIIVIDAGHGGEDAGTQSVLGTKEKEVALAVGSYAQNQLEHAGYSVVMTRTCDVFVPLDKRTSHANQSLKMYDKYNNDVLFISLHANNAPKKEVRGVETYCCDRRAFKPLCKNEESVLGCLKKSELLDHDSLNIQLATTVHEHVLKELRAHHYEPVDRKVRRSVSQVLVGAQMPSMLIELGYLSNPDEAFLLALPAYQKILAHGITAGIEQYVRSHAQA
jgi:N-acetylmuramoyl-L-alanine amidase